jgi:hypothetical protein
MIKISEAITMWLKEGRGQSGGRDVNSLFKV